MAVGSLCSSQLAARIRSVAINNLNYKVIALAFTARCSSFSFRSGHQEEQHLKQHLQAAAASAGRHLCPSIHLSGFLSPACLPVVTNVTLDGNDDGQIGTKVTQKRCRCQLSDRRSQIFRSLS